MSRATRTVLRKNMKAANMGGGLGKYEKYETIYTPEWVSCGPCSHFGQLSGSNSFSQNICGDATQAHYFSATKFTYLTIFKVISFFPFFLPFFPFFMNFLPWAEFPGRGGGVTLNSQVRTYPPKN